ncbi:DUF3408 domain-containing protein [Bacteroides sp. SL.2.06]|uniref:DUF3408 domain-containing protein n=1 Tax=Bacteroidales TaxID=171549 RepID=UPI00210975CC|nr:MULTISPECIES: DUF3408 domain-containing protein [Bacteroidales]MCQ4810330.1 DUF3408 domain-containing protein [Bacteroides sp. SL.2.06]MDV3122017.1 DUF3408 domain-containing protein [Segatella copri]
MVSRKINTDAIDESLLIASVSKSKTGTTTASILNGDSQHQVKDTEEKEEGEKKNPRSQMDKPAATRKPSKVSSESYDAAFLKRNEIKTRQCVYISREIHKRISRIVSVLAKHELTVGGYIDLILERHLEENQEEINVLLRKEIDDWNV